MDNIEETKYKYKCEQCNYKCKFESEWLKHSNTELHKTGKRKQRTDTKEPYNCEKCEYKTKNKTTLKQHILNEHSDLKERKEGFKYYCEICDFGTFSKDFYENHIISDKHKKYKERKINL